MDIKKNTISSPLLSILHLDLGSGTHNSTGNWDVPSVTVTAPPDQQGSRKFSFSGLSLRRLSVTVPLI